jgi:hypothetical protein
VTPRRSKVGVRYFDLLLVWAKTRLLAYFCQLFETGSAKHCAMAPTISKSSYLAAFHLRLTRSGCPNSARRKSPSLSKRPLATDHTSRPRPMEQTRFGAVGCHKWPVSAQQTRAQTTACGGPSKKDTSRVLACSFADGLSVRPAGMATSVLPAPARTGILVVARREAHWPRWWTEPTPPSVCLERQA